MITAIYGGSFNPPHMAHALVASYVLGLGLADRVVILPTYKHAFGKNLVPFEDRIKMCELTFERFGTKILVSDMERGNESGYLLHTLERIKKLSADDSQGDEFRLIIGADCMKQTDKWYKFVEICKIAPPIVLEREGHCHMNGLPQVIKGLSSTRIRSLIGEKKLDRVHGLVPQCVLDYIVDRQLYKGPQPCFNHSSMTICTSSQCNKPCWNYIRGWK